MKSCQNSLRIIMKRLTPITVLLFMLSGCDLKSGEYKNLIGQHNSIWTQSLVLRGYKPSTNEKLTPEHLKEFALNMNKHKVRYAYLFAGPFQGDGYLPDYGFSETAIESIRLLKLYNPQLIILPWIGGIQNKTVHLEDTVWVQNALNDTKKLVEALQVPGVHIDFEFMLPGDPYLDRTIKQVRSENDLKNYGGYVNLFHAKLRQLLPTQFISSVVLAPIAQTRPWKRKTSQSELKQLINYVDQLSFLYYDTQINNQYDFSKGCLSLIQLIDTLSQKRDIQYLIGIGTFINEPELQKYRNLKIENIPNTLNVIRQQARAVNTNKILVDGIAIYCDWATDQHEWEEFDEGWANYN